MHRWKLSALAAAAFVSAALSPTDAAALSLGALTVQSALGEPLRAEISLSQATAAELNSLAAQIASPDVFRAHGIDYSAAANAIAVQIHRHADGTASLRLSSSTPIQDPFIDVVLQTQWNTGQLTRSYTLLLDTPKPASSPATATVAAQVAPPPASVTGRTYSSQAAARPPAASTPQAKAATPASPPTQPSPRAAIQTSDSEVRVRAGDTAGRIANANRPSGVSLDQMLVAMLRQNPQAFINGNVNRLRAGAVIQMPGREQALATSASEARQIVAAQSRDFNAYRRSLAAKAPKATVQTAQRSASGQVQAQVTETRAAAQTPDKLTLSKGSMHSAQAEAQLAAQKQTAEQDNRLSELQRNLAELNELAQSSTTPAAASVAQATASTSTPAPQEAAEPATNAARAPDTTTAASLATAEVKNATLAAAEHSAAAAASQPASAPTPDATTLAPAEAAAASGAEDQSTRAGTNVSTSEPTPTTPAATTATVDTAAPADQGKVSNPWLLPAGAGLAALLLGLLGWRAWQRRGAGANAEPTPTTPVAEPAMDAAMSTVSPDGSPAAQTTTELFGATGTDAKAANAQVADSEATPAASGSAFAAALDAAQTSTSSGTAAGAIAGAAWGASAAMAAAHPTEPVHKPVPEPDFDFDLDLPSTRQTPASDVTFTSETQVPARDVSDDVPELDDVFSAPATLGQAANAVDAAPANNAVPNLSDLNLDLPDTDDAQQPFQPAPQAEPEIVVDAAEPFLEQDLPESEPESAIATEPSFTTPSEPKLEPADEQPASRLAQDEAAFDLGSLDLDLGPDPAPAAPVQPVHNLADDPLATKLDLAQEFNAIGDSEGARNLIEEVLAQASGPLKERAQQMLSELD